MEYLVSIENRTYHHWQIELLLESFKLHRQSQQLLVCLAESIWPIQHEFCRNLWEHPRIYAHQNIGNLRGFNRLNRLYAQQWAVEYNLIQQPFMSIEADMALCKPELCQPKENVREIIFSINPFFTLEHVEQHLGPFWEWLNMPRKKFEEHWPLLGAVMCFQNIPKEIFQRTVTIAESLAYFQLLHGSTTEVWPDTDKAAWAINLVDYVGSIALRGDYGLCLELNETGYEPMFVHYKNGLPPVFNKKMFEYTPPDYLALGDPLKILSEQGFTKSVYYISRLANACLIARKPVK